MRTRLVPLTLALVLVHGAPGSAQSVLWPPPQISAPLVTPTVSHQFLTGYPSLGGSFAQAQPAFTDISGSITAAQCLAGTTGALGCLEVGGGLSVSAGIVQLGVNAGTTHQWFSSVSSGGVLTASQPAFTDISGSITAAQCVLGTTGAVGCLEVGGGLSVAAGIVQLGVNAGTTHQWFSSVSSGGILTATQPAASDLSNGMTGSGAVVLATSPTLVTPTLGAATATTVNKVAITAPSSAATLALANGVTASIAGNLTTAGPLTTTGAGSTTLAFGSGTATFTFPTTSGGDTLAGLGFANTFTKVQTINLNAASFPSSLTSGQLNMSNVDGTATGISVLAGAAMGRITFYRADTTITSPSAVQNTEGLGAIFFSGYDGVAYSTGQAQVHGTATETWNNSTPAHGTVVAITSVPNGTATSQTEALFQNGLVVGTSGTAPGVGAVNAVNGYFVGSTAGVTCSGSPSGAFASNHGIVTHC